MPGGKKGNKKGGGGEKKPNEGKPAEGKPTEPKPAGEPKQEESAATFKFNFGSTPGDSGKQPTFDFGGKDSALLPLMQKKLNSLIGKPSGYFESLPAPIQNRIKALKSLHRKKAEFDAEYKKELKALQEKFDTLIDPLYARRKELVTGTQEPTEEEIKEEPNTEVSKEESKEEKEEKTETEEELPVDVKGVPNFWLEAFKHHGDFAESISKNDEKALKYLIDVRFKPLPPVEHQSDQSFVLEFEFEDNPYFSNKILTKTYFLTDHEQIGETTFDHMEGYNIDWKPGKNLTVKLVQVQSGGGKRGGGRKGRGKGRSGGGGKMITVEEPCESFFNFFKSDVAAAFGISEEDEEMEDGDLGELFEVDYEMGLAVKEQIIASAVLWFTGEIEDPFGEDEEGEDEEGDEEYDSAEDPDFELDPNAPQSEQKPECAQQ